jgi:hypothetical protein
MKSLIPTFCISTLYTKTTKKRPEGLRKNLMLGNDRQVLIYWLQLCSKHPAHKELNELGPSDYKYKKPVNIGKLVITCQK